MIRKGNRWLGLFLIVTLALIPFSAIAAVGEIGLPDQLSFKVMAMSYSNGAFAQLNGQVVIEDSAGAVWAAYDSSDNLYSFMVPTSGPTTWNFLMGNMSVSFSASFVDGFLYLKQVGTTDNLKYYRNEDGESYAFEFFKDKIYITNQGDPGGPVLGQVVTGDAETSSSSSLSAQAITDLVHAATPASTDDQTVGGLVTDPAGSLGAGTPGNGANVVVNLGGEGGTYPLGNAQSPATEPSQAVNSGPSQSLSQAAQDANSRSMGSIIGYINGVALWSGYIESLESANGNASSTDITPSAFDMPSFVFQWVHPDGVTEEWVLPIGSSGTLDNGIVWQTPYGPLVGDLGQTVFLRTFPGSFLSSLSEGTHRMRYLLRNSEGKDSNPRWEYVVITK